MGSPATSRDLPPSAAVVQVHILNRIAAGPGKSLSEDELNAPPVKACESAHAAAPNPGE